MKKLPLLVRVAIAMVLGIGVAFVLPAYGIRFLNTLSGFFAQLLKFIVPLIIVGLVTPAIAESGRSAGRLLLVTVIVAYVSSVLSGFFAFGVGTALFPRMIGACPPCVAQGGCEFPAYFAIDIPPPLDVMTALVFSFVFGLAISATGSHALGRAFAEMRTCVTKTLDTLIVPLLPFYIFCVFADMTAAGKVGPVMSLFAGIVIVIFAMSVVLLLAQYALAGVVARRNPFAALVRMLPAYATALGTSSSAATIPVTLRQTIANGVSPSTADLVIPLCATVHLAGSMLKITSCALALVLMQGQVPDVGSFVGFIFLLAIVMVAAPGVPGGAIMSALGVLESSLGFTAEMNALMITLYIAMDSFGTACNVTGDGAIALALDRFFAKGKAGK